jgi:hypothetical protein
VVVTRMRPVAVALPVAVLPVVVAPASRRNRSPRGQRRRVTGAPPSAAAGCGSLANNLTS